MIPKRKMIAACNKNEEENVDSKELMKFMNLEYYVGLQKYSLLLSRVCSILISLKCPEFKTVHVYIFFMTNYLALSTHQGINKS